jgi:hypothetical protein
MRVFGLCLYALTSGVAAAMIAGCGAPPLSVSNAVRGPVSAAHADARRRAPAAPAHHRHIRTPYQYIAQYDTGKVLEFDYPKSDSPIGEISVGPHAPMALCADALYGTAKKRFWITVGGDYELYEYKYNGTSPINGHRLFNEPSGCARDRTSGNVAVAMLGMGEVEIFSDTSYSGVAYYTDMAGTYYAGYDPSGDLFVDGINEHDGFVLEELPKGHSSFIPVSVGALGFPGNVQYDGKYMAIGDQSTNTIYRLQCIAANCMIRGVVSLDGAMACGQTWIAIGIVFCPDGGAGNVKVYKYPRGGSPVATFGENLGFIDAAVGK